MVRHRNKDMVVLTLLADGPLSGMYCIREHEGRIER